MNFLPFKTFCIVRLQNYLGPFCSGCRSTLCYTWLAALLGKYCQKQKLFAEISILVNTILFVIRLIMLIGTCHTC